MESLEMLHVPPSRKRRSILSVISRSSVWVRAPKSGIIHPLKKLRDRVREGEIIGFIVDLFSEAGEIPVRTEQDGIIIGKNNLPLVNEGYALFHIACFERIGIVKAQLKNFWALSRVPEICTKLECLHRVLRNPKFFHVFCSQIDKNCRTFFS